MRVVLQRVLSSQVTVDNEVIGQIGQGLNLLVGISQTDTEHELEWMANKCLNLRLFSNAEGDRWKASVQDIRGALLVISQFTLYGDCQKGRRPSFEQAADPAKAALLFDQFVGRLTHSGLLVQTGRFGADMRVKIHNDGPVTLFLEREASV